MKLRRKLLAAGFAFGATALTLTTSTFAWYTANTEAKVTEFSGATSATADSSSFYVAAASTYGSNYKATAFTDFGSQVAPVLTGGNSAAHTLTPVAYSGAVTTIENETATTASTETNFVPFLDTVFTGESSAEDKRDNTVRYGAYDANKVYEFVLRFRMANAKNSATNLYFSAFNLTTAKLTSGYVDQIALADGTWNNGTENVSVGITNKGKKYYADLAKAMKLTIKSQNLKAETSSGSGVEGLEADGDATITTYDLTSYATGDDDNVSGANAVAYYNKVLNKNISGTAQEAVSIGTDKAEAVAFASIPTSGYVEVTFTFWLDGWDEYCYDVMQQQTFKFDFAATTESTKAVVKKAAAVQPQQP